MLEFSYWIAPHTIYFWEAPDIISHLMIWIALTLLIAFVICCFFQDKLFAYEKPVEFTELAMESARNENEADANSAQKSSSGTDIEKE